MQILQNVKTISCTRTDIVHHTLHHNTMWGAIIRPNTLHPRQCGGQLFYAEKRPSMVICQLETIIKDYCQHTFDRDLLPENTRLRKVFTDRHQSIWQIVNVANFFPTYILLLIVNVANFFPTYILLLTDRLFPTYILPMRIVSFLKEKDYWTPQLWGCLYFTLWTTKQ